MCIIILYSVPSLRRSDIKVENRAILSRIYGQTCKNKGEDFVPTDCVFFPAQCASVRQTDRQTDRHSDDSYNSARAPALPATLIAL